MAAKLLTTDLTSVSFTSWNSNASVSNTVNAVSTGPPSFSNKFVLLCSAEVTESLICDTGEEWGRGRGSHVVTGMLVTSHLGRNSGFRLIFLARRVSLKVARKGISNLHKNFIVRESSMGR